VPLHFSGGCPLLSSRKGTEEFTITQPETQKSTSLDRFSERLILITGLGILAITLLVSMDVLMRFFLNEPQLFVDDLSSFLLVAVVFLGTGPTFHKGGHIRVDLMTSRLKRPAQSRLRVVTLSIGIAILGIIIYETTLSTLAALETGRVSAVMAWPLWPPMLFIPAGLILMAFFLGVEMARELKSKGEKAQAGPKGLSSEISH
jgi:TRAP-type C4-dicarboxylate transport system permease small subunit